MWNENLQDGYITGSYMIVKEQLVIFGGRCPFKVYIPSKKKRKMKFKFGQLGARKCNATQQRIQ